jgi:hypothetical protein
MRCAMIYIVLKVSGHYEFVLVSFNYCGQLVVERTIVYTHVWGIASSFLTDRLYML